MTPETFLNGKVALWPGDMREALKGFAENSVDSCVTDPPYHLTSIVKRFGADNAAPAKAGKTGAYARASAGFMGKRWDGGDVAFDPETWRAVLRVLKPGAHLIAFSGTRTYHRMVCAIEDAGFEIRDQIGWAFGSGFPKSHDVSKALDKAEGHWRGRAGAVKIAERVAKGTEYERSEKGDPITAAAAAAGWGTALKPAWEPICLARKPLSEPTVAQNVLKWGTGALNIDGCRIAVSDADARDVGRAITRNVRGQDDGYGMNRNGAMAESAVVKPEGRWPANLVHDGSDEVVAGFPEGRSAGDYPSESHGNGNGVAYGHKKPQGALYSDSGSAARFFYTAKADSDDRLGSKHPTVKPLDLMQWLVRLVTPKGGLVLDPFAGTGTTGEAAWREGMRAVLIEREPEYQADIRRRMELVLGGTEERRREGLKNRKPSNTFGQSPLFIEAAQ